MRIVIDISKDKYDEIMSMDWKNCRRFFDEEIRAIHDGKAIEQEPCEDAISREAAVNACLNGWNKDHREIVADIRALPSVNPQEQKIGRWINNTNGTYTCDHCGCKHSRSNYCPNCGSYNGAKKEG